MNWKENINKYIQDEKTKKVNIKKTENEQRLLIIKEKTPPLLDVFDNYNCVNFLKQIKDEVWGRGKILIDHTRVKDIEKHPRERVAATVLLTAKVPCYKSGYWRDLGPDDHGRDSEWVEKPHIVIETEALAIHAMYSKDLLHAYGDLVDERDKDWDLVRKINFGFGTVSNILLIINHEHEPDYSGPSNSRFLEVNESEKEKTIRALEQILIKDCATRENLPFEKKENEIIKLMNEGMNLIPPAGFEYLLDSVEKKPKRRRFFS